MAEDTEVMVEATAVMAVAFLEPDCPGAPTEQVEADRCLPVLTDLRTIRAVRMAQVRPVVSVPIRRHRAWSRVHKPERPDWSAQGSIKQELTWRVALVELPGEFHE